MTHSATPWEKLGRYLTGEASPQEAAEARRWLEEHRSDAEFVAAIERLSDGTGMPAVDVEAALRHVKARNATSVGAALRDTAPTPSPARPRLRLVRSTGWTTRLEVLATAATIVIAVGIFAYRAIGTPRQAPEVAYQTGVGQRDSVRLEDGSVVLLGPVSSIVVRGREVELTGAGYFRVVHDERRPFTVRAAGSVIRDIGTEFSVQSVDTDSAVRVVVSEGTVALRRGQAEVTLEQGDVGSVAAGRLEARRGAATPEDLAWTRGQLIFRNTPLAQVAMDLRRWYGIEVRVGDSSLTRRHFTGSFTTEPRERVVDVLALALGASAELRGDTAFISPTARRK